MGIWEPLVDKVPPRRHVTEGRVVRKDIRSADWDGGGDLTGGKDATATAGYLIDYGTGAGQFQALYADGGSLGNLTVDGDITVDGGAIYTATADPRIRLASGDANVIRFYTGDVDEDEYGRIWVGTSGSGSSRTVQITLEAPTLSVNDDEGFVTVRSESPDGTSFPAGVVVGASQNGTGGSLDPKFIVQDMDTVLGTGKTIGDTNGDLFIGRDVKLHGDKVYFDFDGDGDTYVEGGESNNFLRLVVDNVAEFTAGGTNIWAPNVYSATSGSAANVFVESSGILYRSTSTAKYKQDIAAFTPTRHSVLDLTAVTFTPMQGNPTRGVPMEPLDGTTRLGFTHEDAAANFPLAAGDDDDLDWNAIVAGLQTEVKQLRSQVAELSARL
jgi:hypothetical protein